MGGFSGPICAPALAAMMASSSMYCIEAAKIMLKVASQRKKWKHTVMEERRLLGPNMRPRLGSHDGVFVDVLHEAAQLTPPVPPQSKKENYNCDRGTASWFPLSTPAQPRCLFLTNVLQMRAENTLQYLHKGIEYAVVDSSFGQLATVASQCSEVVMQCGQRES